MFYGYHAYSDESLAFKVILFLVIALLIDLYVYRGTKMLFKYNPEKRLNRIWFYLHWTFLLAFFGIVANFFIRGGAHLDNPEKSRYYYFLITCFFIPYLPKFIYSLFILMNDILTLIKFIYSKSIQKRVISSYLIRKSFLKTGFALSFIMLGLTIYGTFIGQFQYKIRTIEISHHDIPESFDGYKIIQISDVHLGSYKNPNTFDKAIKKINDTKPDLIVCTGDMVNYTAEEAIPFIESFKKLDTAALKYAVLGNHDFGDYLTQYNEEQKLNSTQKLIAYHDAMGFDVLENESIPIKFNAQTIYLIGVHNSNEHHYINHGDLYKAIKDIPEKSFNILLSHNPEHWEWEVVNNPFYIGLTLSGHTHGAQFGYRLGRFSRSPVSRLYDKWGGLYSENDRYLYVNVGLGSVGYLGRIGMRPEITEIILKKKY